MTKAQRATHNRAILAQLQADYMAAVRAERASLGGGRATAEMTAARAAVDAADVALAVARRTVLQGGTL